MVFKCFRVAVALLLLAALFCTILSIMLHRRFPSEETEAPPPQETQTRRTGDAIAVMMKYGANCFRLRLFVNPSPRDEWGGFTGNDLEYTVVLAKRVKASGAKLVLAIHYSDTWADPQRQDIPAAWKGLSFEQLVDRLFEYTRDVISRLRNEGALPDMVQIGNEITCGFLWPEGKVCDVEDPQEQWRKFTTLLKAAIRGVKEGSGSDSVKIILHIHGAGWEVTKWFFSNVEKYGVTYDFIGLSYYPWWHGSLASLKMNIQNSFNVFGKRVIIVETAYPYRSVNLSDIPWADPKYATWEFTPEGQRNYLLDLAATIDATSCAGLLWWYPEAIPVGDLKPWLGGAAALFDAEGRALPALKAFKEVREMLGPEFLLGGDVSALGEVERLGGVFTE
ncbi:glycosyl hydrolase 53 family protein [Thermofilum sp.]|uniref:glycoside hydrolase family 53 protein n=1 Tax=Thermofilum sp. TaxID=1961369 RepID=UPI00315FC45C